jgi:hypothetical protein
MVALGAGCGGGDATAGVGQSTLPNGVHVEKIDHEACDETGHRVETLDANNDGKPDIKRVYDLKTGKELCRITDLDHDGKPDMYEYYDASGTLRRREADYDTSGVINSIEYYEGGKLARRELDTTGQRRIDTWDYFDTASGKRLRRERDSTNDGKVDQWWTFDGDKVTIALDRNGDGKPDPTDTVTLGGDDNAKGPADAGAPAVADAAPPVDAAPPPPPPAPTASPATDTTPADADAGAKTKTKAGGKKK